MAKLEIKLTEEARKRKEENPELIVGLKHSDYQVLIDGRELKHLTEVNLSIGVDVYNTAEITFAVDELDVDAEALAALEAKIEADKVAAASPEETTEDTTDEDHSDEGDK
ncbi:hypothetical protein [Bacillus paralicheniformis]|uniref:hypothetical protein n=2 Tax=Bacillus subtilis group TaxID=653685 RepID=UPI00102DF6F0|nr:hypothetical protein [Bacillus paralicheniformis]RZV63663.1 hypothetical protein EX342_07145 [Bacillus paralicheniformis]